MRQNTRPKKQPAEDWHPADIKAALEKKGWSLSRLSVERGYHRSTLKHALAKPYPNGERIIAAEIGVEPSVIWPSRYTPKSISAAHNSNVQSLAAD